MSLGSATDADETLGVDLRKQAGEILNLGEATKTVELVDADCAAETLELVEVVAVWADVEVDEAVGGSEDLWTRLTRLVESAYALCGDGLDYLEGSVTCDTDAGDACADGVRDVEDVCACAVTEVNPASGELLSAGTEVVRCCWRTIGEGKVALGDGEAGVSSELVNGYRSSLESWKCWWLTF